MVQTIPQMHQKLEELN